MERMRRYLLIFFTTGLGCLTTPTFGSTATDYPNFKDNPYLTVQMQEMMAPCLLPLDHPVKPLIDSIFFQTRVIENVGTLVDAGFSIIAGPKASSFAIVARHPDIPGYVFKMYLDSEERGREGISHWHSLTSRCVAAREIKRIIKDEKICYFTVPDKWLYILPLQPFSSCVDPHPVIVVETDMELVSPEKTKQMWKTGVTRKHLDELYAILKHGYGGSSVVRLPYNVPFTKQKKFAFTDTESTNTEVMLKKVKRYLSPEMALYWDSLINKQE